MKKAVIFDLDGLLIDSEIISYQLYKDLTGRYGHSFSLEEYARNYSGKTGLGNMETIVRSYGLPISIEEGLAFVGEKEKEYVKKGVALKTGAKELLAYLKDRQYCIVLATSSTRNRTLEILGQHCLEHYFDDMVFGTEVENGKPHPDIFLKACEKTMEPAQNCLVLEDSEAGIQAACSAGIDVICIPDMKVPAELFCAMTAAVLPSLLEVIPWLEEA